MFYKNAELHNVECLNSGEHGKIMSRLPDSVRMGVNPVLRDRTAYFTTGCEIRFVFIGEEAVVKFFVPDSEPNALLPLMLYYGSIQAGWKWFEPLNLHSGFNEIVIKRPNNEEELEVKSKACGFKFASNVIRLILPSNLIELIDIEGEIRPPRKDELPDKSVLFLGSSVTNGSISTLPNATFPFTVGAALKADVYNKGFSGSCRLEKEIIDYITDFRGYNFLVAELASNIWSIPDGELENSVRYLISSFISKNPDKKIFMIDNLLIGEKYERSRNTVKKCVELFGNSNTVYINGNNLLPDCGLVSADFIHPTLAGQAEIAKNLIEIINRNLK